MTTVTAFTPSPNANFQFMLTLDGAPYSATCTFNVYRQDYYITVSDLAQNVIFSRPVIGSPDDYDINIAAGFFVSTLVYRVSSSSFEVSP